ncbi:aldehyde dehydrogenase [Aquabacterium sp.]|uniref:aldehyde dehydrogenase n=1 Tax=Aquabacterium sp. TaxID=1872578 RepID=UPI0035B2B142
MSPTNAIDWKQLAAGLRLDGRAFIGGERVAAATGAVFDCISPIDGRKIAEVARGDAADIDRAVAVARAAFDDQRWAGQAPAQRKATLLRFAALIKQHAQELSVLESLDMGKPARAALEVDITATFKTISWTAEAVDKLYDEVAPTPSHTLALVTREPIGVVGAIVPWNYPMLMAAWKIAPALAVGNSVVLKPSEKSPLTALRLAELALEAGVPAGVFNVVPGFGHEAGAALALHMGVDTIGFTGSTRTGKLITQMAGQSNLKRAWTELGGKSPFVLFADADIDAAVKAVTGSIFWNQGESCNAPSRLLVERSIADRVIEQCAAIAPRYAPADPLLDGTVMGALVDDIQLRTVLGYIDAGKAEGAACVAGGEQVRAETGGYYVAPTVFAGVHNRMKIAREEIFGPVLSIIPFDSADEAIRIANDTPYGLAASVWTKDLAKAHLTARALRAGVIHVNSYDEDDIVAPFGGYKQSGNGRDRSLHAFDKYTELKTTWIRLS